MRNFKRYLSFVAVFSLLFTSCSKDESTGLQDDSDMATLSFGAILKDLTSERSALNKAHLADFPVCSDAAPAYAEVVLTGSTNVGTMESPLVVDISANPGDYDNDGVDEYFTLESPDLELTPGNYTLTYFAVFDADGNRIWIAPSSSNDGPLANYVSNPLPLQITLGAGAKKYVDVDVLCYEDRLVNLYGYLFFELEQFEALKFCVFGNYCDENGRDFPAHFSLSVWSYANGEVGQNLFTNVANTVSRDSNGDWAGTTACVALPDLAGTDEYYFEITQLSSDANPNITSSVIRSGVITDTQVRDLFSGDDALEYYHFRAGSCELGDSPILFDEGEGSENPGGGETSCDRTNPIADCDDDSILNKCDRDNENWATFDCDGDGVLNGVDQCFDVAKLAGQVAVEGQLGCWMDPDSTGTECANEAACDINVAQFPCLVGGIAQNTELIGPLSSTDFPQDIMVAQTGSVLGSIVVTYNGNNELVLSITATAGFTLSGYVWEVIPVSDTDSQMPSSTCKEFGCDNSPSGNTASETFTNIKQGDKFFAKLKAVICPPVLP